MTTARDVDRHKGQTKRSRTISLEFGTLQTAMHVVSLSCRGIRFKMSISAVHGTFERSPSPLCVYRITSHFLGNAEIFFRGAPKLRTAPQPDLAAVDSQTGKNAAAVKWAHICRVLCPIALLVVTQLVCVEWCLSSATGGQRMEDRSLSRGSKREGQP